MRLDGVNVCICIYGIDERIRRFAAWEVQSGAPKFWLAAENMAKETSVRGRKRRKM
jgi:hypothetical protein